LCALADIDLPKVPLDGINLVPLLQGTLKKRSKPIAFWNFSVNKKTVGKPYIDPLLQKGTTPLVKQSQGIYTRNFQNYHHPEITENDFHGARAIISGDYKLVIDGDKNTGVELFDLKKDSAERNNCANTQPAIVKKLQQQLRDWQTSVLNSLMEADYK